MQSDVGVLSFFGQLVAATFDLLVSVMPAHEEISAGMQTSTQMECSPNRAR
jgi:hypothetical protein